MRLSQSQQEIVKLLRRESARTVEDLSCAIGISSVAVRQHLEVLEAEGLVSAETERRPIGRPRRLFRLTDAADELFPKNYASLAHTILDYIESAGGAEGLDAAFRFRREQVEAPLRPRMEGLGLEGRVAAIAAMQDQAGYMAEWARREDGDFVLLQHNCSICKIARRFPQACANELQLIENLTGAEVVREQHIAAGDPVCAYRIRPQRCDPPPASPSLSA